MKALRLQIHLLQPLLVAQLGAGEENSSTTFDYIPGSVLRGALIERYLRMGKANEITLAIDPPSRALFFETVVYLNAYLVTKQGQRMLPKPLSWRVDKNEVDRNDGEIYDLIAQENISKDNLKAPTKSFCWFDREGNSVLKQPEHYVNVHNTSEDRYVKQAGNSNVFRYEALAAGQTFSTAILCEDYSVLTELQRLLTPSDFILGGSRSAGYGRVRITANPMIDEQWSEFSQDDEPEGGIVVLTLLSDAILRDSNGQPTTRFEALLGCKPQVSFQSVGVTAGFNRKWGLPTVQTPVVKAGSVFVFDASQVNLEALAAMQSQGIGEQRLDGFGRIAINWHTRQQYQQAREYSASPQTVVLSATSKELAKQMAMRRYRAMLDTQLAEKIANANIIDPPQNAQLARLRVVVRRALHEENPRLIIEHVKQLKAASTQFERAKMDGKRFSTWLCDGVEKEIWQDNFSILPVELSKIASEIAAPTAQIKLEYTMRFLDALLKKATKTRNQGGDA